MLRIIFVITLSLALITPAFGDGALLFEDDFEGDLSKWNAPASWRIEDGKLRVAGGGWWDFFVQDRSRLDGYFAGLRHVCHRADIRVGVSRANAGGLPVHAVLGDQLEVYAGVLAGSYLRRRWK